MLVLRLTWTMLVDQPEYVIAEIHRVVERYELLV